jgi:hypothetical protein
VVAAFVDGKRFGSIGDIQRYMEGASSPDDLKARMTTANRAGLAMGFQPGSPYAKSLAQTAAGVSKRLSAK